MTKARILKDDFISPEDLAKRTESFTPPPKKKYPSNGKREIVTATGLRIKKGNMYNYSNNGTTCTVEIIDPEVRTTELDWFNHPNPDGPIIWFREFSSTSFIHEQVLTGRETLVTPEGEEIEPSDIPNTGCYAVLPRFLITCIGPRDYWDHLEKKMVLAKTPAGLEALEPEQLSALV